MLIVGLGNPGTAYRNTRHNVGFLVLDQLAERAGLDFSKEKFKGLWTEGRLAGQKVALLKPLTYMNKSGESVAQAARNRVNKPEDLLVIYDEAELPLGRLRLRKSGSAGTHNGMKSVVERLGTRDVHRIRMGVGGAPPGRDLADHVLGSFTPDERPAVDSMVGKTVDAVLCVLEHGMDTAMNRFNQTD